MTALAFAILALIALAACGFAVWPILRARADRGRFVLAGAAALFVLGVGGGLYLLLGQPQLAVRSLEGDQARDLNAIIGRLGVAVREHPANVRGWVLLGQAYLTANDPDDAAKAFARAITAAQAQKMSLPFLYSAYGEALTQAASGAVTAEAEDAFSRALVGDPKDQAARFYLGLAAASRGNTDKALTLWRSLLADLPINATVRAELVDRIAQLTAKSGAAPNVAAMVASLAARLKAQPDDPDGWQRLIRAYAVLGDKDKARAALTDARKAMTARRDVLAALDAERKALNL
jgi:cytochrome c-type biogenesis protein CcmH